ncbi:hypothetical protein ILUMI_20534 [Ignelater luminosus]|uniref:PiggyBac transposable element-derived protein domain-containing protein n=1 Tax=Ignelater luminosus TaxID=2038154 RepID=A0A8K0CE44_IGNLU|nr:hypothetical protein ILUMI_20534 [Ignelater luminosus]
MLQYAGILKEINDTAPYHLFFDNLFTLSLLNELKELGIRGTGTLRGPKTMKCPLIESKVFKKKERGCFEYKTSKDNDVMVCRWNDSNIVTLHRISGGKLDQLAFRRGEACRILETYNKDSRRFSKVSQMHHGSSRYDRLDHLAEFHENQRCRVCHKKVKVFCKKCDIALHVKDCFAQYHSQ